MAVQSEPPLSQTRVTRSPHAAWTLSEGQWKRDVVTSTCRDVPAPGDRGQGGLTPSARTGGDRRARLSVNDHSPAELQAGLRERTGTGGSSAGTPGSLRDMRTEGLSFSCHSEVSKKITKSTNKNMNTLHGNAQPGGTGPSRVSHLGCSRHHGDARLSIARGEARKPAARHAPNVRVTTQLRPDARSPGQDGEDPNEGARQPCWPGGWRGRPPSPAPRGGQKRQ